MKRWARRRNGFTVVELLIVVVVIAILAGVSIVGYSAIQSRAQQSAAISDSDQLRKKLEISKSDLKTYPASITDCPTPAPANECFSSNIKSDIQYAQINTSYSNVTSPGYELGVSNTRAFKYIMTARISGFNEFLRTTDLAPYIDTYGLVKYQLDFDIKSANISQKNTAAVYMQNGSGARYSFYKTIDVTKDFVHYSVTFTPASSNSSLVNSYLAFYGTYGTGNVLSVENVELQLAK